MLMGAAAAGGVGALWAFREGGPQASVFVGSADSYEDDLATVVRLGLTELGFKPDRFEGRSVLLKPNLVDPVGAESHANTHPNLIASIVDVFRRWGAKEVIIGEGQGLSRDTDSLLETSGYGRLFKELGVKFVDLNFDDVTPLKNAANYTSLGRFYLPRTLVEADIVVSVPKLKTHHWAGASLSAKNLFGVLPGVYYGWPKNVLHWAGIDRSILDLACLVRPQLSIVDGIIGMEGDGPLMGAPKHLGAVVIGRDPFSVDATAARLMDLDPSRLPYLKEAAGRLGAVAAGRIRQVGERVDALRSPFRLPRNLSGGGTLY